MNCIRYLLLIPLITLGMMSGTLDKAQDKQMTRLDNLAHFIRYTNNKLPYEESYHIASALLTEGKSTYKVLIAIAKVESDFTPTAIGDSGSSLGMLQVRPHLWGRVSTNVYEQVAQARAILLAVQKISRYNGGGKQAQRYEVRVRLIMKGLYV